MSSSTKPVGEVVEKHYSNLAQNYDKFLIYSDTFVRALTTKMIEMLRLAADDVFVDLGGGTGIYSRDILEQMELRHPVILVDPFPEMLAKVPQDGRIECVEMDALGFSEQPRSYDKVLMKEAVHHVDDKARLFANLHERLSPGGALLLVHVPPVLDYPLFEKALARARRWHADPDELVSLLEQTGFEVASDAVDYRHRIPKEDYFAMVRGRYMSLLTSFSEEELEQGVQEMERAHADADMLDFNDHFDFIAGYKS